MLKKLMEDKKTIYALKCIEMVVLLYLSLKMVLNLCYVSESFFDTIRNRYLWIAIEYLLAMVLIIRRIKIHWSQFLLVGIGVLTGYVISKPYWHAIDVMNLFKAQYSAVVMGCVFLWDLLLFKRKDLKKLDLKSWILWFCVFLAVLFIGKGRLNALVVFFPMAPFYITVLDKRVHQKVIIALSGGFYLAFLYTMIKSFLMVPYTGERYYGIFINHGLFGIFIGGAFVCALYWLLEFLMREKKNKFAIVFFSSAVLFTIVCLFINAARISQVACVLLVACAGFLIVLKRKKQQSLKYIFFICIAGFFSVMLLVGILVLLHNIPKESLQQEMQGKFLEEFVLYWKGRADTTFDAKSKLDVIPPGTIMNAIDRFTSGRLSFGIVFMQRLNWLGHESTSIELGNVFYMHPHNTFIFWLFGFGIVGGGLLSVGFCIGLAKILYLYLKENENVFFSALWLIYFALVSMGEVVQWTYSVGFFFLILLYPIFCKKDKEN